MDVAWLNFSHGTHEEHGQNIEMLREAAVALEEAGDSYRFARTKIRTGAMATGEKVLLRAGQKFTITTAKVLGDSTRVSTVFRPLPHEVKLEIEYCWQTG